MNSLTAKLHGLLASKKMLYIYIFFILISETSAMSLLKEYSLSGSVFALSAGLACYFLVCIFFELSLKFEGMGMVNILWSAFSVIFVVTTGVLLFGEEITKMQMLGIGFVITGVVFLRSGDSKKSVPGGQCIHVAAASVPSLSAR